MKKSTKILSATLLLALLITYIFTGRHSLKNETGPIAKQQKSKSLANSQFRDSAALLEPAQKSKVEAPAIATLRKEIGANVHISPKSLVSFAANLGKRMEEAEHSEALSLLLLRELKDCAQPAHIEESPVQARALCLVKAKELGQRWPGLKEEADDLINKSDHEASGLAASLN